MNLQPAPQQPGLWVNQDWTPGTPGTFALLIGVSRYDHLDGGQGPIATNTYGLAQLAVSAWTTYALFDWLHRTYAYTNAPLAHCWLLLAPTDSEIEAINKAVQQNNVPDVLTHNLPGTFNNLTDAVALWSHTMAQLPKAAAEASRSFFFFSGHGLEIHQREQVLLPTDYLRLPNTHNRALSIRKLADAMTTLPVCDQFFFVDACRNTHPDLAALSIQGDGVLTITSGTAVNSACNSAILYATASGMPAHQYNDVDKGYSLFGRSLLDGLQSQAGFVPECAPQPCSVQLAHLQRFIGQRYNQLLQAAGWQTRQYIKLGSEPLDLFSVITHVPSPTQPAPYIPSVWTQEQGQFTHRFAVDTGTNERPADDTRSFPESAGDFPETTPNNTFYRVSINALPGEEFGRPPVRDMSLHDLMGRETVTAFWDSARLYDRRTGLPLSTAPFIVLEQVERTDYSPLATGYRVVFSVRTGHRFSLWLEFTSGQTTFGMPLPINSTLLGSERTFFQINFNVAADGQVTELEADLANNSESSLRQVANLWEKYQTVNAVSAAELIDMTFLQDALQAKRTSPFGAVVGSIVLLQARRYDLAKGDWLRNLAEWFPALTDGLLLRNYWLLQTNAPKRDKEVIANLLQLLQRGMPCTGEAFSMAVWQLDRLLSSNVPGPKQRTQLERLQRQLRDALRYFRPGGLLAVFAGQPGSFTPQSLGYR
ncbi:caspase family protein [Fibrella sp. WM1]|uniref:caspase family protein n=1 Tax=Fibrella musci TaxID=3242485 RepID=UPI003521D4A6